MGTPKGRVGERFESCASIMCYQQESKVKDDRVKGCMERIMRSAPADAAGGDAKITQNKKTKRVRIGKALEWVYYDTLGRWIQYKDSEEEAECTPEHKKQVEATI